MRMRIFEDLFQPTGDDDDEDEDAQKDTIQLLSGKSFKD
jgi:hypothetical protein